MDSALQWNKSRGIAVLIALFLGGIGGHWFYLDNVKRGLLYLLFAWTFIPALISWYDILTWAFMDEHAWHEKYESHRNVNR